MTKTFENCAAQGDIKFVRIDNLPSDAVEIKPSSCREFVLSHSETGHKHIVKATPDVQFFHAANDNMTCYLVVNNPGVVHVEHMRGFDTHEPIVFPAGTFKIKRQREYSPEGWRVAMD